MSRKEGMAWYSTRPCLLSEHSLPIRASRYLPVQSLAYLTFFLLFAYFVLLYSSLFLSVYITVYCLLCNIILSFLWVYLAPLLARIFSLSGHLIAVQATHLGLFITTQPGSHLHLHRFTWLSYISGSGFILIPTVLCKHSTLTYSLLLMKFVVIIFCIDRVS